jgi:nucleotide-binding universal stress UspA family protein
MRLALGKAYFQAGHVPQRRIAMRLFQTIIHPTDFDEPSKEAFRVARSLAQALEARVVVFHVLPAPAVVTQDGRVIPSSKDAAPVDLWAEYRKLQADVSTVPIQYAVVVGEPAEAKSLLEAKVRELGPDVVVVMGSHGRTGLSRLLWGSRAEEVVRDLECPVLVVKAPARAPASSTLEAKVTAKAKTSAHSVSVLPAQESPAKMGGCHE